MHGSDSFWVTDITLSQRLPRNQGTLTLGIENLFDSSFRFQDTDTARSSITPERRAFVQLNLSF
jgi:outer membrane receptor protein involved in Fe transport